MGERKGGVIAWPVMDNICSQQGSDAEPQVLVDPPLINCLAGTSTDG